MRYGSYKKATIDTSLQIAAGLGYCELVKYLVGCGADIRMIDSTNFLQAAIERGSIEVVQFLEEHRV